MIRLIAILLPTLAPAADTVDYPDAAPDICYSAGMGANYNSLFTTNAKDGNLLLHSDSYASVDPACSATPRRFYGDVFRLSTRSGFYEGNAATIGGVVYKTGDPIQNRLHQNALLHSSLQDMYGKFVRNRVMASREEWQDNRGFMVMYAGRELSGGTYAFAVKSAAAGSMNQISAGMHLDDYATTLSWHLTDPALPTRRLSTVLLGQEGRFLLRRFENNAYQRTFYVEPNTASVGINSPKPAAALDVNGFMKLKKLATLPACTASADAVLALNKAGELCVCKSGTGWLQATNGKVQCAL
jgi:hypothetical protein